MFFSGSLQPSHFSATISILQFVITSYVVLAITRAS